VIVALAVDAPYAGEDRFLDTQRRLRGNDRADLAFAQQLVEQLAVACFQATEVDALRGQAVIAVAQALQQRLQCVPRTGQRRKLFRFGQHRNAMGIHALRHADVFEHVLIVGLRAGADIHHGDVVQRIELHGVALCIAVIGIVGSLGNLRGR